MGRWFRFHSRLGNVFFYFFWIWVEKSKQVASGSRGCSG